MATLSAMPILQVADVEEAAGFYAGLISEGVDAGGLRDQPYGCRDFDVVDPDGNRIVFGQDLAPRHGHGLGRDRGRG